VAGPEGLTEKESYKKGMIHSLDWIPACAGMTGN
jgi:hypothetical protein